jgi:hypothetical protein
VVVLRSGEAGDSGGNRRSGVVNKEGRGRVSIIETVLKKLNKLVLPKFF